MSGPSQIVFQERTAPSRPYRLGTRRRRPHQAAVVSEPGASRSREPRAPSLDTEKHLATSVANWLKDQETDWDIYQNRLRLWRQLLSTVHQIWQDAAAAPKDDAEQAWWNLYGEERAKLKSDENPAYDEWLEAYVKKNGLPSCGEGYLQTLYMAEWKKQNKPQGRCAETLKWEKQYFQLLNCQGEWIGYRAGCCGEKTRPVAVPIGCNHRLCPLCNWHRSQKAQIKTKTLFDRLVHPQFLTFTSPNLKTISKRSFGFYRKKVRKFLADHPEMFKGGVYAMETTYNRTEKTWHVHAHALVDASFALPTKDQRVIFAGRNMPVFTYLKLALEYDWSSLWCKDLGRKPRKNASKPVLDGARAEFEWWTRSGFDNALKEFRGGQWRPIRGLSASEIQKRTEWNQGHRRVFWIKPVDDRERAAKEVLKYITKSADFCDLPECVKAFYDATKGARMMQTFGSWFGVNFDAEFDTKHLDDWRQMKCTCGVNAWEKMGTFQRRDVEMSKEGRWYLQRAFDHNSAGTVPRPTIRALDMREEHGGSVWQTR